MKKIFFISVLMLFSADAFSQLPPDQIIAVEKVAARHLKVYNYTKCTQYFLVAGLKDCKGCNQNQEDYLTDTFYKVPAIDVYGNPGILHLDGFNLFINSENQVSPGYISHVKIPHYSPPMCSAGQTIGENYCLSASTKILYQGMMHCEIKCYSILATWEPAKTCDGFANLTFKEYQYYSP